MDDPIYVCAECIARDPQKDPHRVTRGPSKSGYCGKCMSLYCQSGRCGKLFRDPGAPERYAVPIRRGQDLILVCPSCEWEHRMVARGQALRPLDNGPKGTYPK